MSKGERIAITYIPVNLIDIGNQPIPELLPETYSTLKQDIVNRGVRWPIDVIPKPDGRYRVLNGRNRLKAVTELNHPEIPCIIRDAENGYKDLLLTIYDPELFRRRLSDKGYKRLLVEKNQLQRKWTQKTFDDYLQKIIPELHEDIKQLFEKTKDPGIVINLALLPKDLQKAFYKKIYVSTTEKEAEQKLAEALQRQKEHKAEKTKLTEEIKKLSQYQQKYEQLEEQHNASLTLKKKEVEERLKKKEKEIREQYRAETLQEVQKLLLEERRQVEAEYKKEIEEFQKELKDIARSKAEIQKLINTKQKELAKTTRESNLQKNITEECKQNIVEIKTKIAPKPKKQNKTKQGGSHD